MSTGGEKWVSLRSRKSRGGSSTGNLLIDIKRGPLPPTSPGPMSKRAGRSGFAEVGFGDEESSMPSTPRSSRSSNNGNDFSNGSNGSNGGGVSSSSSVASNHGTDFGLAGVLHLNIADMSGIGLTQAGSGGSGGSGGSTSQSAFLRIRAVPVTDSSKNDSTTGISVITGGILTYGLETCTCSASTTATTSNRTGSLVWDEPLTLSIPNSSRKRNNNNYIDDNEKENEDDWKKEWNLVLSTYMASGSGTYDLVGEYMGTIADVLSQRQTNDGNINVTPWIVGMGTRTTSNKPTIRFQASLTDISNSG